MIRPEDHIGLARFAANRYIASHPGCEWLADDLVSAAYEGLMKSLETYDPKRGTLSTYLCTMIWWFVSRSARKLARGAACADDDVDGSSENDGVKLAEHRDALTEIVAAARLTSREQHVVGRRFFDGAYMHEIGEEFGCSRQNIEQIERRALAKLRRAAMRIGAMEVV